MRSLQKKTKMYIQDSYLKQKKTIWHYDSIFTQVLKSDFKITLMISKLRL